MIKRHVPNFITLLNLLSGSIAVVFAVQNNLIAAALFAGIGIFFDFFDGILAKALDAKSELGVQLDSLADSVTSGLVPGIVMFQLLRTTFSGEIPEQKDWASQAVLDLSFPWIAGIGLLITLASAYRLANFNIDDRQDTSFIGLPTPANNILILSLPVILAFQPTALAVSLILNEWFLIGLTLFSCFILNANIPLFALKFDGFSFGKNFVRYIFLLISLVLLVLFKFLALPLIILVYLLVSIVFIKRSREKMAKG